MVFVPCSCKQKQKPPAVSYRFPYYPYQRPPKGLYCLCPVFLKKKQLFLKNKCVIHKRPNGKPKTIRLEISRGRLSIPTPILSSFMIFSICPLLLYSIWLPRRDTQDQSLWHGSNIIQVQIRLNPVIIGL